MVANVACKHIGNHLWLGVILCTDCGYFGEFSGNRVWGLLQPRESVRTTLATCLASVRGPERPRWPRVDHPRSLKSPTRLTSSSKIGENPWNFNDFHWFDSKTVSENYSVKVDEIRNETRKPIKTCAKSITVDSRGLHSPALWARTVVPPVFRHWTLGGGEKGRASGKCSLSKHCNPLTFP